MPEQQEMKELESRQQASTFQVDQPTLPSGGGSIRGMDEKFTAQPATGTYSFQIPVYVSPGRMGVQPELALSYNSGSGNGPFGLGWSCSIPSIRRKSDKRLPSYDDWNESDVYQLSDAEDLVPKLIEQDGEWVKDKRWEPPYEVTRYRPRSEQAYARIERWWNKQDGTMYWQTISRDHVISVFGRSEACRIAHPQDPTRVYAWLLEERMDDKGNIISYEYKAETAAGASMTPSNRYIKRIFYGNKEPHTKEDWLFEVVFDYGDHDAEHPTAGEQREWTERADAFSSYRAGFEMRTARLCQRILMFHHAAELGGESLVRSTDLRYEDSAMAALLVDAWQTGYTTDDSGEVIRESTPSVTLTYTMPIIDPEVRELAEHNEQLRSLHLESSRYEWIDLDQVGLSGILSRRTGEWTYIRNMGDGTFASPVRLASIPADALAPSSRSQLADLAGGGTMQLVSWDTPTAGYYEREADGWGAFTPFPRQMSVMQTAGHDDLTVTRIDLNGDGRDDLLRADGDTIVWYPSLGLDGYGDPIIIELQDVQRHEPILMLREAHQTVYTADMNGDGLSDIVRIRNGDVCYWPNMGHGRFGVKVVMQDAPQFDHEDRFDPRRIRIADIDGSGTADLMYLGEGHVRYWLNESGNGWGQPRTLDALPEVDSLTEVRTVDLLANGTQCLVWSSPLARDAGRTFRYINLMGHKPYLLQTISNNMGSKRTITYKPSTYDYIQDELQGTPWRTKLPYPVQVVARIEVEDEVQRTRLVSEYRYRHGYYDGVEREFRGFGYVEQSDTETAQSVDGMNTAVVKTWFHTGCAVDERIGQLYTDEYVDQTWLADSDLADSITYDERSEAIRSMKGKMLRLEIYGLDHSELSDLPYQVAEYAYSVEKLQPLADGEYGSFYCYERESVKVHTERRSGDPRIVHHLNLHVDRYGHVQDSVELAYPRLPDSDVYAEQSVMTGIYTSSEVVHLDGKGTDFRLGVPIEERTYEMCGLSRDDQKLWTKHDVETFLSTAERIGYEEEPESGTGQLRLIGHQRMVYWDDSLSSPLDWGETDLRALSHHTLQLVLTQDLIDEVYGSSISEEMLELAGYVKIEDGYWSSSGELVYAPQLFYQVIESTDSLGHKTTIAYDDYALFPVSTTDPLGNETTIVHDYRSLQPKLVTDANGNRNAVQVDALGRVIATAVMGKVDAEEGDTLSDPTSRFEYDYGRWQRERRPVRVRQESRVHHGDPDTEWQASYVYYDGSGRTIAEKKQTSPGLAPARDAAGRLLRDADGQIVMADTSPAYRWITTGYVFYDHKGNPIKEYEPYFSATAEYEDDEELKTWGVSSVLTYDPLGRNIRSDLPNGTYMKTEMTAWQTIKYDASDTVLDSRWYAERMQLPVGHPERRAAELAAEHDHTPYIEHQDVLGRTFLIVQDNGDRGKRTTRITLDIQGRQRSVTDPRGNTLVKQTFDLTGGVLCVDSADAGKRRSLLNAAGNPVITWNDRGEMTRTVYDAGRRPTHVYVQRGDGDPVLMERFIYGEAHPNAETLNLRGQIYRQYDGAGMVTNESYDFKGNLLSTVRRLAVKYDETHDWSILDGLTSIAQLEAAAESSLESEGYRSETMYNALNIPITLQSHDDTKIVPSYNPANQLQAMDVYIRGADVATRLVESVSYDARGERLSIHYGNGLITDYTYDRWTYRLQRVRTLRGSTRLQDLTYTYDPAGNVMEVRDGALQTVYFDNTVVEPVWKYEYDALYQLVQAEGREHAGTQSDEPRAHLDIPVMSLPHANDGQAMRRYIEQYAYDVAGNMVSMKHLAGGTNVWTRQCEIAASNNRLLATSLPDDSDDGALSGAFTYDASGNMTSMPHLTAMHWNYRNELTRVELGGGGVAYYTYDIKGQRMRKVVERTSGLTEETIYLGGVELYRRRSASGVSIERETIRLQDDRRTVALVDTTLIEDGVELDEPKQVIRYQMDNHLGSACLETDEEGRIISYEEYYPFGDTSYQASDGALEASRKRYRFHGKERDEETGLYYYGVRYYIPWLGRWISCDPGGLIDGANVYAYVRNNPVANRDEAGMYGEAGHFYTVYFVSLAAGFDEETAFRNAFYSQMPDMVNELDAIEVQKHYVFTWMNPYNHVADALEEAYTDAINMYADFESGLVSWASGGLIQMRRSRSYPQSTRVDQARRTRDDIQRGFHDLTGGLSAEERAFRDRTLSSYEPGSLEFGLTLHAYGDSYAHSVMRLEDFLYQTGWGHLKHWTHPDEIHRRPDLYAAYVSDLFQSLSEIARAQGLTPRLSEEQLEEFIRTVSSIDGDHTQADLIRVMSEEMLGIEMNEYAPEQESKTTWDNFRQRHDGSGLVDDSMLQRAQDFASQWNRAPR